MRAMVLCAGLGTRLGELTHNVPKPMLMVEGNPLLEYIIKHLSQQGYRDIAVNLHFIPDSIKAYFGDGSRWNVNLHYSYEPQLLGTAGALKKESSFLCQGDFFLVHYGDILTDQNMTTMLNFHREKRATVTMLVHQRRRSNSMVEMDNDGRVVGFWERPTDGERQETSSPWVNSGVFLCSRDFLNAIPAEKECDIPRDILPFLIKAGSVYGFPLTGYLCAVDSAERLREARAAVAERRYAPMPDGNCPK
jgi:NDP-sugar pyrophosphorylase family protein